LLEEEKASFSPEDATVLIATFEDTLHALRLVDRSDPAVIMVAKRVIQLAKQDGIDPARLRDQVLQSFRNDPGASGM
jgi:hypothetical protein